MNEILQFADGAFVRATRRAVTAAFDANRVSPNPSPKIPIIGEVRLATYDPHGSPEEHAPLIDEAVLALLAKKWFEDQIPRCWQGIELPLNETERAALYATGDRRLSAVADYAQMLRGWDLRGVQQFIDYYAR